MWISDFKISEFEKEGGTWFQSPATPLKNSGRKNPAAD
jgi:hypothetical protein